MCFYVFFMWFLGVFYVFFMCFLCCSLCSFCFGFCNLEGALFSRLGERRHLRCVECAIIGPGCMRPRPYGAQDHMRQGCVRPRAIWDPGPYEAQDHTRQGHMRHRAQGHMRPRAIRGPNRVYTYWFVLYFSYVAINIVCVIFRFQFWCSFLIFVSAFLFLTLFIGFLCVLFFLL